MHNGKTVQIMMIIEIEHVTMTTAREGTWLVLVGSVLLASERKKSCVRNRNIYV